MNTAKNQPHNPTVAVVGGGLAGMAAAVALAEQGFRVELFEQHRQLGGRAGSFLDPRAGRLIDYCQHLAMGCCTNLADFCRRTGIADCFRRQRKLFFFGPDGTQCNFSASPWLPAPLHLAPGLMRLRYLSFGERLGILRTMGRLARETAGNQQPEEIIGAWLRRHGQSDRVIERFWSVVLVSALGETVERASLAAAGKVFGDGFLGARRAYELEVPTVPLGKIFDLRAGAWLAKQNVAVHRGTRIRRIEGHANRATAVVLPDGTRREFDFIIVAVPWRRAGALFSDAMLAAIPSLDGVEHIQPAPITAVHLWFNRPITPLPHAVLVGKLSQWIFSGGEAELPDVREPAYYYQAVISASRELAGCRREDLVGKVRRDIEAIWPNARRARLLHSRVVTRPAAVFSVAPGIERFRPIQQTPIENLMLAGDWTATGWPATMEGAVRSGYLAAEATLQRLGRSDRFLVPDLPRSWLARRLFMS